MKNKYEFQILSKIKLTLYVDKETFYLSYGKFYSLNR